MLFDNIEQHESHLDKLKNRAKSGAPEAVLCLTFALLYVTNLQACCKRIIIDLISNMTL
jgi:hypothetical protein